MKYRKKPDVIEAVTFDEFVEYGLEHAESAVNGMPWHFKYNGHPVTHENDECYLIGTIGETLRFTTSDVLITGANGEICVRKREFFEQTYESFAQTSQVETWVYSSIGEAVTQLEICGYTCAGGPLENNTAFQYLKQISEEEITVERLVETRAEFEFELVLAILKDEPQFFERGNCEWGEKERVVGILPLEDTEGHGDVAHKLALFDFDGNYVEDWNPTSDDVLAIDWRIADLERNRAFRDKHAELRRKAFGDGAK